MKRQFWRIATLLRYPVSDFVLRGGYFTYNFIDYSYYLGLGSLWRDCGAEVKEEKKHSMNEFFIVSINIDQIRVYFLYYFLSRPSQMLTTALSPQCELTTYCELK